MFSGKWQNDRAAAETHGFVTSCIKKALARDRKIFMRTELAFDKGFQDSRSSGTTLNLFVRMGIGDVILYYVIAIADNKPICSFSMQV